MQQIELAVTYKQPDTESEIIRQGLVEIAEICQKELTPALVQIWVRDLSDIPAELLCRALEQLRKTWTSGFLPTPGNVRALINKADASGQQLEAEDAWEKYLTHVKRFFHPDIGWNRRAPQLSAIIEHAGRAAGGPHWVECCPDSDLVWARKRFIEAYFLAHETGQVQHLLTRGEAKEILGRLREDLRNATAKQITQAPADPTPPSAEDNLEIKRGFDELREKLGPAPPVPLPRRKLAIAPHDPPPENFAGTPEGKAFREWAQLYDSGKTKLMWADYKAQMLSAVCV